MVMRICARALEAPLRITELPGRSSMVMRYVDRRLYASSSQPATKAGAAAEEDLKDLKKPLTETPKPELTKAEEKPIDNVASTEITPKIIKQVPKMQHINFNITGYGFTRFFDIVQNYDKVLEKNFPSAMKVYRIFFDGVQDFYADMKRYLKVSRIVNESPQGVRALNRKELELYRQLPRDIIKVAPALVLSSLPLVGYAVFPLAFMYPRVLLSSHFWNPQQLLDFQLIEMRERHKYAGFVLTQLQERLSATRYHEKHSDLKHILAQLSTGFQPSVDALLDIKDIFADNPLKLDALSAKHTTYLNLMYGLRSFYLRRTLREHGFIIHYMDLAIGREGGVHNLMPDALNNCCIIRGLNATNIETAEKVDWMRKWIHVSTTIKEEHMTLFLHLPLFLGYNHPNNWLLTAKNKENENNEA